MTRRLCISIAAAVLSLGACAELPRSGPVERVADVQGRTHSAVRYTPAGPRPGATPQQVAAGYLDAMLAYPEATSIVQSYFTPRAVENWNSAAGITVYSASTATLGDVVGNAASVRLRTRDILRVDRQGRATVQAKSTERTLRLQRVGGEWRVANPVPGYLVSKRFAKDYLRSYPLWFFDESGTRLVPELVHAVVGEQLPLVLARRLAAGPQESTLRTALPESSDLRMKVQGKVIEIDIQSRPQGPEDKMAAQLLSTLRGVPALDGVRILVQGALQGEFDMTDAVVGFGTGPSVSRIFAIRSNSVVEITDRSRPIAGPWGQSAKNAVNVAVDGAMIAALQPGRSTVTVGRRRGGPTEPLTGVQFADPVWDDDRGLWLVDNPGGVRVRVWRDGVTRDLATDGLGPVQSFAVSPDRSRYAAVTGSADDTSVVVGMIEHDDAAVPIRLLRPRLISAGRSGERAVGWVSASRIGFLAQGRSGRQLHSVGLDGDDLAIGAILPGGIVSWAGTPEDRADRWALDSRGRLWRRPPGMTWRPQSQATYRAVSAGR